MNDAEIKKLRADLRVAVADLIYSEGCGCCQDLEASHDAQMRIAKMLNVPKFKDGSGYDFFKYKSD